MSRLIATAVLFLSASPLFAQTQFTTVLATQPGLKLNAVPEVLTAHLPDLHAGKGAWVAHIEPRSSAYLAGLRKHDIILRVGDEDVVTVRDCSTKLAKVRAGQSVDLLLIRGGQEKHIVFSRAKADGSATSQATASQTAANQALAMPKSFLKPGGPPAVSVQCQPKNDGKLDVTILYYLDNSGKLDRLELSGAIADIETQFQNQAREQQLPERVVDLVDVALRRLREINQNAK